MRTYDPTPGSIPARAISHLRSLPAGSWISGAELAVAIGLDDQISPYIQAPLKHGLIVSRKDPNNTRLAQYCLGDGTPPIKAEDMTPDEPLEPRPTADRPIPVSAFDAAKIIARTEQPAPAAEPAVERRFKRQATTVPAFRAGLWTDGMLVIEAQGTRLVLVPEQVTELRQLIAWSRPA